MIILNVYINPSTVTRATYTPFAGSSLHLMLATPPSTTPLALNTLQPDTSYSSS